MLRPRSFGVRRVGLGVPLCEEFVEVFSENLLGCERRVGTDFDDCEAEFRFEVEFSGDGSRLEFAFPPFDLRLRDEPDPSDHFVRAVLVGFVVELHTYLVR